MKLSAVSRIRFLFTKNIPDRENIMNRMIYVRLLPGSGTKAAPAAVGLAALVAAVVIGMLNEPAIRAQNAATPKFEAASIRPCEQGHGPPGFRTAPGRYTVRCLTVKDLLGTAYMSDAESSDGAPFARDAISGGPAWMSSDRYDIEAKAEDNASGAIMRGPMLRALLEERFGLKLHGESKEIPLYELIVARSGFKLKSLPAGSCTPFDPFTPDTQGLTQDEARAAADRRCNWQMRYNAKGIDIHAANLDQMAARFSHMPAIDRPVVNRTGIAGIFDFHLEFSPGENATRGVLSGSDGEAATAASDGASIFTALQNQLGLRLEAAKGPGEFLVIDHVERPSDN